MLKLKFVYFDFFKYKYFNLFILIFIKIKKLTLYDTPYENYLSVFNSIITHAT